MKKIYSIFLSLGAGLGLSAQVQMGPVNFNHTHQTLPQRAVAPGTFANKVNHSRSSDSYWVNYGVCMDSSVTGPDVAVLNDNYLCTDSTLLGNFGGTYAGVWVNNLGDILDVHAQNMQNYYGYSWGNQPFSVDSMSVLYAYTRNLPSNIVDTMIVTLYYNLNSTIMPTYYFTGMAANFGSDTLLFKAMPYSYTTNLPSASNKVIYKIPLTEADSSVFFHSKDFATNYWVPGGGIVASSVTFKPGYAYNAGDSIDNKDAFYFASYEEGGANTFPLYQYCPHNHLTDPGCDWNCSQIVTSDVRYNNDPSWDGFFIPSYAYTVGYGFEHHLIFYKVTSLPNAVAENIPSGFELGQNIPNPTNGNTVISYTIPTSSKVSMSIVDVTGKEVMNIDKGQMSAGEHQIELNTAGFSAGVYFYTLTVDGQKSTRRLVVTQ